MRHSTLRSVVAGCILAGVTACLDDPLTSSGRAQPPSQPPALPEVVIPAMGDVTVDVTELVLPVGDSALLRGPLRRKSDGMALPDVSTASSDDASVLQLTAAGVETYRVRALRAGRTGVTLQQFGRTFTVPVQVLDTTAAPSPVVVARFGVREFGSAPPFAYAPMIELRDTSAVGPSHAIGVWFELPDGSRTPRCRFILPVDATTRELFPTVIGDYDGLYSLFIDVPATYRIPRRQPIVAHLTLRVPGPFAKELVVQGEVFQDFEISRTWRSTTPPTRPVCD
jgi:hypothetical protein